jgi:ArsR family metal-binding transcriptional regulator
VKISDFNLAIHETCAEEGKVTVEGRAPGPLDLAGLARKAEGSFDRTMLSLNLGVLYLLRGGITIHLHADGGIVVNRVGSTAEAEEILKSIFPELCPRN